jgi:hypothetical protein
MTSAIHQLLDRMNFTLPRRRWHLYDFGNLSMYALNEQYEHRASR